MPIKDMKVNKIKKTVVQVPEQIYRTIGDTEVATGSMPYKITG